MRHFKKEPEAPILVFAFSHFLVALVLISYSTSRSSSHGRIFAEKPQMITTNISFFFKSLYQNKLDLWTNLWFLRDALQNQHYFVAFWAWRHWSSPPNHLSLFQTKPRNLLNFTNLQMYWLGRILYPCILWFVERHR